MCCCTCPPPEPYTVQVVPFPETQPDFTSDLPRHLDQLNDMTIQLNSAVMHLQPQLDQLQSLARVPPVVTIESYPLLPSALESGLTLAVLSALAIAAVGIGFARRRSPASVSPVRLAISSIDALSDQFLADVARLIRRAVQKG